MSAKPPVTVVGIPMDLGQSRRGVDMGPSALRYAGLHERLRQLGYATEDLGNLELPERETLPPEGGLAFLPAVERACEPDVRDGARGGGQGTAADLHRRRPLDLGRHGRRRHPRRPVRPAVDRRPRRLQHPRDEPQRQHPRHAARGALRARRPGAGRRRPAGPQGRARGGGADRHPRPRPAGESRARARAAPGSTPCPTSTRAASPTWCARRSTASRHLPRFHVSLDMDVLDPREAPGVGTPVTGGLTYREAHLLMEILAQDGRLQVGGRRGDQSDPGRQEPHGRDRARAGGVAARASRSSERQRRPETAAATNSLSNGSGGPPWPPTWPGQRAQFIRRKCQRRSPSRRR